MVIDTFDYILLPFYIFIFYIFILRIKRKHYTNSPLGRYLVYGFWAKIFASISFALVTQYLYPGDSFMYYTGGLDFKEIIFRNFPQHFHFLFSPAQEFEDYYQKTYDTKQIYGYLGASSNLMTSKFVAFFSLFTFNKYLIISLCFGMVSFSGLWQCFKLLSEKYPLLRKHIAMSFLFLPSVLFWGSGVMKDSLCVGFLGWLFVSGYKLFIKRSYNLKRLLIFLTSLYCVSVLKLYILIAFLPFFFLWVFLERIKGVRPIFRVALLPMVLFIMGLFVYENEQTIAGILGEYAFENFTQTVANSQEIYEKTTNAGGALINADPIEPTLQGIIKAIPVSMVTTLFRPFIWESKKFITFLSALENLVILVFSLYVLLKSRIYKFFVMIFRSNLLFFFFFFSIVFATAIGLTCYNFGTLVRYKIPCMPFYLASLIIILHLFRLKRTYTSIEIKKEN